MKLKRYIASTIGVLALSLMVGCTSSGEVKNNSSVKDENKGEVVVTTSVAITEILDKLGVKVGGVPKTSYELPKSTEGAVEVGNPMNPDLEIIKSLNPSVVVSVDTLGKDYEEMFIQNNIPSEFVNLSSVDGLKETIKSLGNKFDKSDKASEILNDLENKENELKDKTKDSKEDVMIIFAAPGSMMIGTDKSYVGNLVDIAGGNNLFKSDKSSFLPINIEEVIKANPKKILVMTHAVPEESKKMVEDELSKNTSWQRVDAVKNGNVHYLENEYFGMSANLKAVEAIDKLGVILYE
ncbi:MAG: heme ABC transporter substrate-binding protein IsdE [Paraclostridium sp.]|uniref:heme ABC transporter substrate-binding protein IsdE n=1 Tax=Paraclostridium sp. TaxID=2023273 RepID=UPI003F3D49CE